MVIYKYRKTNFINKNKYLFFIFAFFFSFNAPAFFGDEIDFLSFPDNNDALIIMEYSNLRSSWDLLHNSQVSSITKLDEVKQKTLFSRFNINNQWDLGIKLNNIKGSVTRSAQPFEIDTSGNEFRIWFGTNKNENENVRWRLYYEGQKTDPLVLECYSFNNIVIGGRCQEAKFIFRDALNPNTDDSLPVLPIVNLKSKAKIIGLEFQRPIISNTNYNYSSQLRLQASEISSDFDSPLLELESPVLLGLVIENKTIGELREDLISQLPQAEEWYEFNLTLGLSGWWSLNTNWKLLSGLAYTYIDRKDYQERVGIKSIKNNLRLDLGILWNPRKDLGIYFKGFATTHNTLGYEPIAYNRRTSSVFNKKYGELSVGFIKTW